MNTIVLATDGSPSAQKATRTAIELALTTGWELRIVTAWTMTVPSTYGFGPMVYPDDFAADDRERGRSVLDEAVATARAAGLDARAEFREGMTVDEICNAAAECNASLIVIGAHGWGPVKRLLFGSVSTGVLHHAPCPVLVVRGEPGGTVAEEELTGTRFVRSES